MRRSTHKGFDMAKRIIVAAIIVGCLFTPALADHWNQHASLIPGTYLLVYASPSETSNLHTMYEYFEMQGIDRVTNFIWIGFSAYFEINEHFSTEALIKYLNTPPETTLESHPILFRLVDDVWLTVPLPCKWVKGDTVM